MLAVSEGKVMLTDFVLVFWLCVADNDKFTDGYFGNVLEYEIEELNVLFKKFVVLIWFKDSRKYELVPKLTEDENLLFGLDLLSLLWDHLKLKIVDLL